MSVVKSGYNLGKSGLSVVKSGIEFWRVRLSVVESGNGILASQDWVLSGAVNHSKQPSQVALSGCLVRVGFSVITCLVEYFHTIHTP